MRTRIVALVLLFLTFVFAGCGGAGGTVVLPFIFIADGNNRIVLVRNMLGAGWATFGSTGNGVGQFNFPSGMALDAQGRIYICDYFNNRIVRINDITGAGWVEFGTFGSGANQFDNPYKIAIDSLGRIYVTDSGNNRVVRIDDMTGTNWVAFGTVGNGANQFSEPIGIAIDSSDRVYVTDWQNDRIARFDDMTGTNWTTLGTSGTGVGQFDSAVDISITNNQMLIVDRSNRVILTNLMSTTGWDEFSMNTPQSAHCPQGAEIYIVDQSVDVLTRMDDINGTNLVTFGTSGSGVDQFSSPTAVRVRP
jgi:hypothetical protein